MPRRPWVRVRLGSSWVAVCASPSLQPLAGSDWISALGGAGERRAHAWSGGAGVGEEGCEARHSDRDAARKRCPKRQPAASDSLCTMSTGFIR
jgi:hypothetical protein